MNEMDFESWLWIRKEEKKWYKVAKNLGAKKSLNSFVNFLTNIKNYWVELTEVGCKTCLCNFTNKFKRHILTKVKHN